MKYLTILNFNTGTVHQYKIDNSFPYFDYYKFMIDEGFNLDSVQWMVHDTNEVIYEN